MVTGISAPGALVTTHRPFPNRTDSPGTSVPGCNFCPGVFRPVRWSRGGGLLREAL